MLKRSALVLLLIMLAVSAFGARNVKGKISTKEIADLDAALKAGVPVVVKIGADWCAPCRAMKPILKELSEEQDGKAIFLDLNIDKYKELARQFKVMLLPTILFYDRRGKFKTKSTGYMSKEELLKMIKEQKINQ